MTLKNGDVKLRYIERRGLRRGKAARRVGGGLAAAPALVLQEQERSPHPKALL